MISSQTGEDLGVFHKDSSGNRMHHGLGDGKISKLMEWLFDLECAEAIKTNKICMQKFSDLLAGKYSEKGMQLSFKSTG